MKPDQPFVLRVEAGGRAVGGVLEQFVKDCQGMPTLEQVETMARKPVAFYSRKLVDGQRKWAPREVETYAIVQTLRKWQSWIGNNPVLVLTDHKTLESWYKEDLDTPSGPIGRRARWHELFSLFDLKVQYVPGRDNVCADALSRWAYPASQAFADATIHGSEQDAI